MKKHEQSFANFVRALNALTESVATPPTEDRDYAGIIQSFEFTYELCWKTLKLILEANGIQAPFPRIAFEEAFKAQMIEGNEIWREIIEARNLTSHTYDQKLARKMVDEIKTRFLPVFANTSIKMKNFV
jgi:nucleotidyltransferase substrate binding protein (TIGR01987 family)